MCLICIEFQKGNLNLVEAWSNYSEMALDLEEDHRLEIKDMLELAEEREAMEADYYHPEFIDGSD